MKQEWNEKLFWNYQPSNSTFKLGLSITNHLSKLDSLIQSVFVSRKMPSRLFAFIESKYSSRIEGIYTTLFDVVNTGVETNQQKLIQPLVNALFTEKVVLSKDFIYKLEEVMNFKISKQKRYENDFGIYQSKNVNGKTIRELIYKPPNNKKQIDEYFNRFFEKIKSDENIVDIIYSHILFEKIHPFVDANGRLGRLIFQKSLAKQMNFAYVLPVSWAFFNQISKYYQTFDITDASSLDDGVQNILNIFVKMCDITTEFINEIKSFLDKNIKLIKTTSSKMDDHLATRILLTLQTKSDFLQKRFNLNPRTINSIFEKLNNKGITFNTKIINRKKAFWNIELESIIDNYFN